MIAINHAMFEWLCANKDVSSVRVGLNTSRQVFIFIGCDRPLEVFLDSKHPILPQIVWVVLNVEEGSRIRPCTKIVEASVSQRSFMAYFMVYFMAWYPTNVRWGTVTADGL